MFIISDVVRPGRVATMSEAGSNYGISLTCAPVLASVCTHVMIAGISRLTTVSGKTPPHRIHERCGASVCVVIVVPPTTARLTSNIRLMRILVDVLRKCDGSALGRAIDPLATPTQLPCRCCRC